MITSQQRIKFALNAINIIAVCTMISVWFLTGFFRTVQQISVQSRSFSMIPESFFEVFFFSFLIILSLFLLTGCLFFLKIQSVLIRKHIAQIYSENEES